MKKALLFIAILSVISSELLAQNYQTIQSDRIAYFNDDYGGVKCIRIDSLEFAGDSIFHPMPNIRISDDDCFSADGPSWIGEKVIIGSDGYNYFLNKRNDTIKIKVDAMLHETWTASRLGDSVIITAEIIEFDTLRFLGQLDSVKTIAFQVLDTSLSPLSYDLNEMTLMLSKNFGFVKSVNFYLYPNFEVDNELAFFLSSTFREFDLVGLSKPEIGIQNLTWMDVHDYQVGDELHIFYEDSDWPHDGSGGKTVTKKIKNRYLERINKINTIIYTIEDIRSVHRSWADSSSTTYSEDTVTIVIRTDTILDPFPDEPFFRYSDVVIRLTMTNGTYLSKYFPDQTSEIYFDSDTCGWRGHLDGCDPTYEYRKGLGGPYYKCSYVWAFGGLERRLVYYNKSGVTGGTPFTFTGITESEARPKTAVFPNPASSFIYVRTNNDVLPAIIQVFDLTGRLVAQKHLVIPHTTVDLSDLTDGLYIYSLANNESILETGKLIIAHH